MQLIPIMFLYQHNITNFTQSDRRSLQIVFTENIIVGL